jgi:hypothetical protein
VADSSGGLGGDRQRVWVVEWVADGLGSGGWWVVGDECWWVVGGGWWVMSVGCARNVEVDNPFV